MQTKTKIVLGLAIFSLGSISYGQTKDCRPCDQWDLMIGSDDTICFLKCMSDTTIIFEPYTENDASGNLIALSLAIHKNKPWFVRKFMEMGALKDLPDTNGRTAYDLCRELGNREELIKILDEFP